MDRSSATGAVDSGLIPSRVKPITLKLVLQLPCSTLSIEGTVWRTSRQVYLLYRWKRHLAGFPHLCVVDRWLATSKGARYSAMITNLVPAGDVPQGKLLGLAE